MVNSVKKIHFYILSKIYLERALINILQIVFIFCEDTNLFFISSNNVKEKLIF